MKGILVFLFLFVGYGLTTNAQVKLTLQVQNTLPADVGQWASNPASVLLTSQIPPTIQMHEAKLVIGIQTAGARICGIGPAAAPIMALNPTQIFKASDIIGLLANCPKLKGGSYELCAQFFNVDNRAISELVCRPFNVVDAVTSNSRIVLINPVDGTVIPKGDIKKPMIFKWVNIPPAKPGEEPLYSFQIFETPPKIAAMQAIRGAGSLVFQKTVTRETQLVWMLPPDAAGKKYAWTVQRVNKNGQGEGENNGYADPFMFAVSQYAIQIDSIHIQCSATPNVYTFSYQITNPNPGTAKLSIFSLTSSTPAGATLAGFAPPIGTTIASGASLTITGTINSGLALTNACLGAEITDVANTFNKASKDTCKAIEPCKCTTCDSVKITVPDKPDVKVDNGNLVASTTITVSPKLVKSIKAELVYFEYKPQSDDCLMCNKDSKTFGNFMNVMSGNQAWTIPASHTAVLTSPVAGGQAVNNLSFNYTISLPPTVKCCSADIKWCIRYVITFDDCTVCNKLVCSSYSKLCECK